MAPNTGVKGKWDDWVIGDEQGKECTIGGNSGTCLVYFLNSRDAESFANSQTRLNAEQRNAVLHAYWFALNRYDTLTLGYAINEGNLRTFGRDHEGDWRDSYLDAAKDVANNEIGINIGRKVFEAGLSRDSLGAIVLSNLGQLNCISGDIAYGTPTRC